MIRTLMCWAALGAAFSLAVAPALADDAKKPEAKKPAAAKPEAKKPGEGPAKPAVKKEPKEPPLPGPFKFPPKITLTPQQQAQVEALAKEYGPRLKALDDAKEQVYTPQQRDARKAAREKAHAAGLRGKEAAQQVEAAVTLSADQKARLAELDKQKKALDAEIHAKLAALLTAEQRAALGGKYADKPQKKEDKKPGPPPPAKKPKEASK
jgi:hypothetical protein